MRPTAHLMIIGLMVAPVHAVANDAPLRLCDQVIKQLDSLASVSGTLCVPGPAEGAKRGKASTFLLVAPKPFMSTAKGRSAYAVLACAAVGHGLNADRSIKGDDIWITDTTLIQQHQAYVLPASLCQRLQPRVQAGGISLEDMRSQVEGALRVRGVPP